jgi:anti-sigma factor RsiW
MSEQAKVRYVRELRCQELVELVTDYLEGSMIPGERVCFEQHLARCEGCTHYLAEMRKTLQVAGALREEWIDPAAKAGMLAAFRDWKNQTDT